MTTDKLIAMARECGFFHSHPHGGYVSIDQLAAFRRAILADAAKGVEPFVFEEYPYHAEAMGCGLEDRGITNRYEAMAYGWERAMERAAESIPDDLVSASTVAALQARVEGLEAQLLAAQEDSERLNWLDRMNFNLNKHYKTAYHWKVILSPNVVRLMVRSPAFDEMASIDLHDSHHDGVDSCRAAIDAARSKP